MKKTENTPNGKNVISRKEAVKKMGKYATLKIVNNCNISNQQTDLHIGQLICYGLHI